MDEGDADQKAEKPEHISVDGAGSAKDGEGGARPTSTAQDAVTSGEAAALLEDVLRRENLTRASVRVVRNGALRVGGCPIAVVGMGCVLPGARDTDSYWRNVLDGRERCGRRRTSHGGSRGRRPRRRS